MKQDHLMEPYIMVLTAVLNDCPKGLHRHSFFELVYIVTGTGKQCINNVKFNYKKGHFFLLTPQDAHSFEIESATQFFFIRFNEGYIRKEGKNELIQRLEMVLRNARHDPGCVLKNASDKLAVKPIMEALIREFTNSDLYHKELIEQYINTLLVIVARNISLTLPESFNEKTEEKAIDILQYIQANIYYPEKLRAEQISKHFAISENYLGRYFKKHAGETFQQYILNYKLKLIENRLLHSNMRMSEIADEFGFTDKSHLNRLFKKYKGMNPGDFKKSALVKP